MMARTIAAAPLRPDIAMPVLVGGFVFAADLLRALAWEGVLLDVEMIWLRSYGDKRVASAISMVAGPSEQITGRHVLVIDGVLDAGRTIAKAVSLIEAAGGSSARRGGAVLPGWRGRGPGRRRREFSPRTRRGTCFKCSKYNSTSSIGRCDQFFKSSNKITPRLHTSLFLPYGLDSHISGER